MNILKTQQGNGKVQIHKIYATKNDVIAEYKFPKIN